MTRGAPRLLRAGTALSLVGAAVAAWAIFVHAPADTLQGPVQRIFYLHVSAAIGAYLCFGVVFVCSVIYLARGSLVADRLARAAAPVGLLMTSVNLLMGIIWAKPIWLWDPTQTWDARFTSTVMLWAIYAGYLLVRRFATPGRQAARFAAVVGCFGFADVPITYFSVSWWRTLHPGYVLHAKGGPALPPEMLQSFMVTLVAVLLATATLVLARYRVEALEEMRERQVQQDLVALEAIEVR
jgi:heme exporter protein C